MIHHEHTSSRELYLEWSFDEWLELLEGENHAAAQRFLAVPANHELVQSAPGSRDAHHAWPGGYKEHLRQSFVHTHILFELWQRMSVQQQLPDHEHFTESDALTVMFLHDVEKPFIYAWDDQGGIRRVTSMTKAERKAFRQDIITTYGFCITPAMQNALQFVEGVRDDDYVPGKRADWPLAALCHAADNLSARGLYSYRGDTPS